MLKKNKTKLQISNFQNTWKFVVYIEEAQGPRPLTIALVIV